MSLQDIRYWFEDLELRSKLEENQSIVMIGLVLIILFSLGLVFCQLTGGGGSFSQDVKLTYFDVDSQTIRLVDHSYPDIPASPLEGTDNVFLAIVFSCEECEKGKIKDGMSPEDLKDNGMFIGWLERAPDGPDDEATARYGEGYLYRSLDNDRWFRDIDTGGQKIMQMPYDRCQNARVCTP